MTTRSISRQTFRLASCALALAFVGMASEAGAPPPAAVGKTTSTRVGQTVQLGVAVSKPGTAVYAQLPKLPRGSGFLLQSVTPGSSAAAAGLRRFDVIWKLDDQLLINENQLMVLLSHRRPGDKVKLAYFHAGQEKEASLVLKSGTAKPTPPVGVAMTPPFPGAPGTTSGLPALPIRVISYEDRSASISDKHGTATLTFREGKPWLQVESAQGVETFNASVAKAEDIARVPSAWKSRLPILQRSLEESARLRRLPRVRYVPRQKPRIAEGK